MKNITLASKSVDRKKLFERAKLNFEIFITNIDEQSYMNRIPDPIELVKQLAKAKSNFAKKQLIKAEKDSIIVAADTIVELNGEIIGKAQDEEEAFLILKKLSSNEHSLITGIAVTETFNPKMVVDHERTVVKFLPLEEEEIWSYIDLGEWKGRAGAYSIREKASLFIEYIRGSPSNVIGLPMERLFKILRDEFHVSLL
ncbi:MAG: septum formation protein Maf [Promethearchaeota archaeon]|nr:MAG: septum formation protein Maf [Candidatus Lokiarchaeota archaeon]